MDRSALVRLDDVPATAAPVRMDLYGPIHKALRAFMFDTVARLGRCDAGDPAELADTVARARGLLHIMRGHLTHENGFVHPAIEARRPGGSAITGEDHEEHERAIAALDGALDLLEAIDDARRPATLHRTYLRFARFVAENLEHMEVEETHNTALLHAAYDDAELMDIHDRLLASIPPAELMTDLRWIVIGVSHPERVGILTDMRAKAPPPAFAAVIDMCRDVLSPNDWGKLANALGLPAGAGLVEVW
jgi:hypothetical protein